MIPLMKVLLGLTTQHAYWSWPIDSSFLFVPDCTLTLHDSFCVWASFSLRKVLNDHFLVTVGSMHVCGRRPTCNHSLMKADLEAFQQVDFIFLVRCGGFEMSV